MYQVVKRDGQIAEFDIHKIGAAIQKAFEASGKNFHPSVIDMLALKVTANFEPKIKDGKIKVEEIQDSVEEVLSQAGYADVAKGYILYRKQREKIRNLKSATLNYKELVNNYLQVNDWRVKENSTVTYSVGGLIPERLRPITGCPKCMTGRLQRLTATRTFICMTFPCSPDTAQGGLYASSFRRGSVEFLGRLLQLRPNI